MIQVSDLHIQAKTRLQEAYGDPKKIVLIHTAVALGCSLLLTGLLYLFDYWIANTGGLGGMGTRSVLTTIQSILELVVMILLPFWQLGIYRTALLWADGQRAYNSDLLHGFRRWIPSIKLLLMRTGLFLAFSLVVCYACATVYLMTPFAAPIVEILEPMMQPSLTPEQMQDMLTPEVMETLLQAMTPLLILSGIVYAPLAVILFYRLRFADFGVMNGLAAGIAIKQSFIITRKCNLWVFRLDLSMWWFYLIYVLSIVLSNMGSILPLLGVSLPVPDEVSVLVFYIIGILCQGVLLWRYEDHRLTAYALAYRTLDGTINGENENQQS